MRTYIYMPAYIYTYHTQTHMTYICRRIQINPCMHGYILTYIHTLVHTSHIRQARTIWAIKRYITAIHLKKRTHNPQILSKPSYHDFKVRNLHHHLLTARWEPCLRTQTNYCSTHHTVMHTIATQSELESESQSLSLNLSPKVWAWIWVPKSELESESQNLSLNLSPKVALKSQPQSQTESEPQNRTQISSSSCSSFRAGTAGGQRNSTILPPGASSRPPPPRRDLRQQGIFVNVNARSTRHIC